MHDVITYDVDAADIIRAVGGDWARNAAQHGGAHPEAVIGHRLWDFVEGATTRHMYHNLASRVRERAEAIEFPYRCDSPNVRRDMRMRMVPLPDGWIHFESRTVGVSNWRPVPPVPQAGRPTAGLLQICSWCKRGLLDGLWVEPEVLVAAYGMLLDTGEQLISHAICPSCVESLEDTLLQGDGGRAARSHRLA